MEKKTRNQALLGRCAVAIRHNAIIGATVLINMYNIFNRIQRIAAARCDERGRKGEKGIREENQIEVAKMCG